MHSLCGDGVHHLAFEEFGDGAFADAIDASETCGAQPAILDIVQDGEGMQLEHLGDLLGSHDAILHYCR